MANNIFLFNLINYNEFRNFLIRGTGGITQFIPILAAGVPVPVVVPPIVFGPVPPLLPENPARVAPVNFPAIPALPPALGGIPLPVPAPAILPNRYEDRFAVPPTGGLEHKKSIDSNGIIYKLNVVHPNRNIALPANIAAANAIVNAGTPLPPLVYNNNEGGGGGAGAGGPGRGNWQIHLCVHDPAAGGANAGRTYISLKITSEALFGGMPHRNDRIQLQYQIVGNRSIQIIPMLATGLRTFTNPLRTAQLNNYINILINRLQEQINTFLRFPVAPAAGVAPGIQQLVGCSFNNILNPLLKQQIGINMTPVAAAPFIAQPNIYNINGPDPAGNYNIYRGGNQQNKYKEKYLKYKQKYLALKNKLNQLKN